jgi:hypothetical protein
MSRFARISRRVERYALSRIPVSDNWMSGVFNELKRTLTDGQVVDSVLWEVFMTFTKGTSNKYHAFGVYRYAQEDGTITYVGGNAYGRIGGSPTMMVVARGPTPNGVQAVTERKSRAKLAKGYELQWEN